MGRMYTVEFENASITNANGDYDFFEISPADDKPCVIHACYLDVLSETGDAEEEMLRIKIIRGHTTGGNGTSTTPQLLNPSDAAAGFAAETVASTPASLGTAVDLHSCGFNVRVGWEYVPTPECRPIVTQAQTTLVVRLMAAVTDDVTMSGTLYVEELG